jgi:hypothetical protein
MKLLLIIFSLSIIGCIAIKPTERLEFSAPDAYPEGIVFDIAAGIYYES